MATSKLRQPPAAQHLGAWIELSFEKIHGPQGARYSRFEHMLRMEFKRAVEGDLKAIRTMMRALDLNLKARDEFYNDPAPPVIMRDGIPTQREKDRPRNADLALLILGICAVQGYALKRLGRPGEPGYEAELKILKPTYIEPWVKELRGQPARWAYDPEPNIDEWHARRADLLSELMRVRGPGGSRFKPGRSGNPRGRPRRRLPFFPYDDFFTAAGKVTVDGKKRRMTRLDALMAVARRSG